MRNREEIKNRKEYAMLQTVAKYMDKYHLRWYDWFCAIRRRLFLCRGIDTICLCNTVYREVGATDAGSDKQPLPMAECTTVQALQEMLRNEIIHLHLVFE